MKTRDQAREFFEASSLSYSSLTKINLQHLRRYVNRKMVSSGLFDDTYRCKQRPYIHQDTPSSEFSRFYAGIKCKAFYFDDRECISFNPDGFIGFAGWASDGNVQPILEGFIEWVKDQV